MQNACNTTTKLLSKGGYISRKKLTVVSSSIGRKCIFLYIIRFVSDLSYPFLLGQVQPMIVIRSKGSIAFGALSLSGFISGAETVETEDMEAFY